MHFEKVTITLKKTNWLENWKYEYNTWEYNSSILRDYKMYNYITFNRLQAKLTVIWYQNKKTYHLFWD